ANTCLPPSCRWWPATAGSSFASTLSVSGGRCDRLHPKHLVGVKIYLRCLSTAPPPWCRLRCSRRGTASPLELLQVPRPDDIARASAAETGSVDRAQLAGLDPASNAVWTHA